MSVLCAISGFDAMEFAVSRVPLCSMPTSRCSWERSSRRCNVVNFGVCSGTRVYSRRSPKNLQHPRRPKLPPEFGTNLFLKKRSDGPELEGSQIGYDHDEESDLSADEGKSEEGDVVWEPDEVEAITSLFQGRIPQKPGKLNRERPLPLPLPHKLRPLGLPSPKKHFRYGSISNSSPRASITKQVCRNPAFLIGLAREIKDLPSQENASAVLDKWARFLRKGSLCLTVRELGHMELPDRALQTFCWAQKQSHLFPDDRLLASAVEVLAKNRELKVPANLEKFIGLASRSVLEAMVKGFIESGSLGLAWKFLRVAKRGGRMLDSSIYAKLILKLGKSPDKGTLVLALLDELAEREDLNLSQQDCTSIMKVCIRIGKFEAVESLFNWFKQSGRDTSVVMYTTVIHSRYLEKKYREALAIVWEMEASDCLFDLPAYRVVIKLCVALNDLPRSVRYFAKLKEAGFSPPYDVYRAMFGVYMASGRIAKCKEICKEAEKAGFNLDTQILSQLLEVESAKGLRCQ